MSYPQPRNLDNSSLPPYDIFERMGVLIMNKAATDKTGKQVTLAAEPAENEVAVLSAPPKLPHDHGQNIEQILARMPDTRHIADAATLFDHLRDANRLRIFWLLCHAEECVMNISAAVSMSSPAVSHHLRILKASGLIESRRAGKEVYYRLAQNSPKALLLHQLIDTVFDMTCPNR